ncbi:hypothetical protein GPA10_22530 [Streptomyces sp. p1417]|uniref:Uncharacterized protein n=1 Tax=Streptomyces typhae TaxID=2681492 RepID=A0A6L6X105_9ACTN|nr:hypothetical protein [Streptomyces typhae]MVO87463.1 hypothetical protein [Streptomyces typhae]
MSAFRDAPVAPNEPANWLLKNPRFVVETFHDPDLAVHWYGNQVKQHAGHFDGDHAKRPETIEGMLAAALGTIKGNRDVVNGWWGKGGTTFFAIHLIACPNFWRPEHACPLGLR